MKWEYKSISICREEGMPTTEEIVEALNIEGEQGWEAIHFVSQPDVQKVLPYCVHCFLKRQC